MSDARMRKYADWLIANQAQKGTPEFDKVAGAYKDLRQQQNSSMTMSEIGDTAKSLGTGIYDRVLALGSGAADLIPTVNKAITGYENPRLLFGNQDGEFTFDDLKSFRMVDEKEVPEDAVDLNPFGDFTGKEFEDASNFLDDKREELNHTPLVPWEEVKANPSAANVLGFMGEAAVTSLPDMAASVLASPAYFASYIAPIVNKRAENDGRSQPTPSDLAFATIASLGIATAEKVGAKGIFSQQAGNVVQRTVNAGVKESATEAIQNPLEYAAETVGTKTGFDTATALDQSAAGAVGGLGAGTTLRGTTEALTAGGRTEPEDPQAASDLANRLTVIEKVNKFKPGNVSQSMDVKGARAMLDQAHTQIAEEIKKQKKFAKDRLKDDPSDSDAVVKLKSLAEAGFRQAGNKTKNTVGQQEYNAVEQLLGDTAEGQRILKLFRESNELTTLHNQGLKGGLSKYTDKVNPLSAGEGYSMRGVAERVAKTALYGGLMAAPAGPAIAAGLGTAAVGGRIIDGFTGSRSNVANYMRQNAGQSGVRETQSPALRKARQKDQYKKREFNAEQEKDAYEQNLPIGKNNKPASMVNEDTGLNRREQVELAERMLMMNEYKVIHEQLKQLIKSVKGEYQQVQNINGVIERMMGELQKTQQQSTPQTPTPQISQLPNAARQQGILDNQNRLEGLRNQAMGDGRITAGDRDLLNDTFDQLKLDLGSNPVEAAESIIQGANALANNKAAINKYLNPYLERVRQQQKNREVNKDEEIQPLNFAEADPFKIGSDIGMTAVDIMPTNEELAQMKAGTFKPEQKQKLEVAYGKEFQRWKEAAGQDTALEYTPENVDRLAGMMATEALKAVERDGSAIGWYDSKLKAAKSVMRLAEPRIDQNEAAFDFALAVTSNGQAVTQNFQYALDVFRGYLDNGVMPEGFKQGGDRNAAMVKSFKFYNAWEKSSQNQSIDEFLNEDFSVRELKQFIASFNEKHGTKLDVGSSESVDTVVKGSFILGPKIGQGFYQNIRGNYDPLTMDIWWMRMWNRLVGRPFEAPSQERDILKRRNAIKRGMVDNKDPAMRKIINQALEDTNETRKGLYTDPARFDKVIKAMGKRYQSFYAAYNKKNGKNHNKPGWLATVGTHIDKSGDKLQAVPAGGGERAYMREVVSSARSKLKERGFDINTADFQALMWYPEKQLAEKMGIAKGKGQDNDYLDAAILSAEREGISNEQIQEALPDAERERLFGGTSARGADGRLDSGTGRLNASEERSESQASSPILRDRGSEQVNANQDIGALRVTDDFGGMTGQEQAVDLVKRINAMRRGYQNVKGETVINLDLTDRTLPELVRRLDPEGRETLSLVQVGLKNHSLTNEEIEKVLPHLTDTFKTLLSDQSTTTIGTFDSGVKDEQGRPMARELAMVALDAPTRAGPMSGDKWMSTFLHELGHSIESGSGLRKHVFNLKYMDIKGDKNARMLMEQAVSASRERRPSSWSMLDANLESWRNGIPFHVPTAHELARMSFSEYQELVNLHAEAISLSGMDGDGFRDTVIQLKDQIDYLYKAPELSADALASYMKNPVYMKKMYPELAAEIRNIVNNSDISKFITFHTAAALAGTGAVMSIMQSMLGAEDDEEKGILSLGTGSLSSAA